MQALSEVVVTTKSASVATRVTHTHVVQTTDEASGQTYASIPIKEISSIELKSQPIHAWLVVAGVAGLVALVLVRVGLPLHDLAMIGGAILAGSVAWFAFLQWEKTRDERLLISSSSASLEIQRRSAAEGELLDLIDAIEAQQEKSWSSEG